MSTGFPKHKTLKRDQECVYKVSTFYSDLTKDAQDLKLKHFSQVPKFHLMEHLACQGKFLNPRFFWTYMSEDFVGKIARMGSGLLRGTARPKVALKIIKSYTRGQELPIKILT